MSNPTQTYRLTVTLEEIKLRNANMVSAHHINFNTPLKKAMIFFNLVCAKMYYLQARLINRCEDPTKEDIQEAASFENRLEAIA